MRAPVLEYNYLRESGIYIIGDGPQLATVREVSAYTNRDGSISVWVRGFMRRKDGTTSRVNRSREVAVNKPQPPWLQEIIDDARRRLA